jgi:hypothetical protein
MVLMGKPAGRFAMGWARAKINHRTAAVWLVWALASVWVAVYVAQHGHNLPASDEWAFVRISYAPWSERLDWLGERHMEHRFPLARAVFLGLLESTGHDFRAGMWLTTILLSCSAAALILAANRLRGRTSLADAGFPLLFLHLGHTENLLMGYQIAFTITVAALALFALLIAHSHLLDPMRAACWGAALLVPIALGGWLGLVFIPPLVLWVGWQWWRARGAGLTVVAILAAVVGYFAWSVWFLLAAGGVQHVEGVPDPAERIRALLGVTGVGLGPGFGRSVKPGWSGAVILAIQATTIYALVRVGRRWPEERPVTWGLLTLMMGVWAFALAVGFSRGSGLASRYSAFTALGIAIPLLAVARYSRPSTQIAAIIVIGTALVAIANERHGRLAGMRLDERYRSVLADRDSGMPIDLLAERHQDFWIGPAEGWLALWEHDFPLLRGVPAARPREVHSAIFQRDGEAHDGRAVFARYRVDLGAERPVLAVRVRFRAGIWVPWERMMFDWIDPTTGENQRSAVRPWIRPINQSAVFWIDGSISGGDLLIGRPDCPIEVLGVEVITLPADMRD